MERRLISAFIIIFAILFIYYGYILPKLGIVPKKQIRKSISDTIPVSKEEEKVLPEVKEEKFKSLNIVSKEDTSIAGIKKKADTFVLKNSDIIVEFNSLGGVIQQIELKKYKKLPEKKENIKLFKNSANYFGIEIDKLNLSNKIFKLEYLSDKEIIFSKELSNNLILKKIYSFNKNSNYIIDASVVLINRGKESIEIKQEIKEATKAGLIFSIGNNLLGNKGEGNRFDNVKAHCYLGKKLFSFSALQKKGLFSNFKSKERIRIEKGVLKWIGFSSRYFIATIIPLHSAIGSIFKIIDKDKCSISGFFNVIKIKPEHKVSYDFQLYAGPKIVKNLKRLNKDLESTVDFGWFDFIAYPMLKALVFIREHTPGKNYGIAIIIISILIKIILSPLTYKSMKSMKKMQELQPQIQAIQKKYKDNKEKLQKEIMKVYSENKVNPFGGCLPILLQLPIFIALFRMLEYAIELRGEPFILWIRDLSSPDPLYILPVLMGITMYIQQKMSPAPMDPQQQKMMLFFNVFFIFISASFPSGLVLYWISINVISILYQFSIKLRKKAQ